MGDPTIADVMEMLKSLTTEMKTMKADMAAMQEKSASSSDRDVGSRLEGPRDLDRPPRFQKLDFPHYDSKTDPMHNEDKGYMILDGDVFDVPIRKDIVHRVVR
jgi:hypothetical protein